MNGWTEERKARARALMLERKPWLKSTGPRTPRGIEQARKNLERAHEVNASRAQAIESQEEAH